MGLNECTRTLAYPTESLAVRQLCFELVVNSGSQILMVMVIFEVHS